MTRPASAGPADYLIFLGNQLVGEIKAKRAGVHLTALLGMQPIPCSTAGTVPSKLQALAELSASAARSDPAHLKDLAALLGLSDDDLADWLDRTHGRTKLVNAFGRLWPATPDQPRERGSFSDELAEKRNSDARHEPSLQIELARIVGAPPRVVEADLQVEHHRNRLDNCAFESSEAAYLEALTRRARVHAPETRAPKSARGRRSATVMDDPPSPRPEVADDAPGIPPDLAALRVSEARTNEIILVRLAEALGRSPGQIRAALAEAHHRQRLDRVDFTATGGPTQELLLGTPASSTSSASKASTPAPTPSSAPAPAQAPAPKTTTKRSSAPEDAASSRAKPAPTSAAAKPDTAPPPPRGDLPSPPRRDSTPPTRSGHGMNKFSEKVSFIWSVADLLRGDYKQSEYGRVILPFLVLRRLDQVLAPTRDAVLKADAKFPADKTPEALRERMLLKASGESFYNTSKLNFTALLDDSNNAALNLTTYVHAFSKNVRDIMEKFRFDEQVARLDGANLLFLVLRKFVAVDLDPFQRAADGSPKVGPDGKPVPNVTNLEMGYIFEELIRKFSEQSNETAGEHFTPREVIKLMVTLLFAEDDEALHTPGVVRTMYDPACGTGGMLSVAEEHLSGLNPQAQLKVFGQEINAESYAICKADMLIKGQDANNIKFGNSFTEDGLSELKADYLISNPPFGVDWSKAEKEVREEHEQRGHAGRFGPGLPRKNDGSLLFLLHMLSKMKPASQGGSRLAIVFNGSPLFTGAAESGESEIRRWIIENDLLEAIVALPDQMFYNTGISTYIWLVTNRKPSHRAGTVQLINGVSYFQKMRKSLGDKRKELGDEHIRELAKLYADFDASATRPDVKVFDNEDFGFHRITVERPLRLNFQASEERIARLDDQAAWKNLLKSKKKGAAAEAEIAAGQALQEDVLAVLQALDGSKVYDERPVFEKALKAGAKAQKVSIPGPVQKAILSALSERDETAAICMVKGQPEPDPDLRDYENVPLKEDIGEYMEREVLPHVPDAWVDESKTKVGYEIPFTRHFYVYEPPRALEVIEKEIRELEREIQGMLAEVLA